MADMNHLELASETPQQPVDVDTNEVLREYGLDGINVTSTVVQQANGTSVTIPDSSTASTRANTLTPPPITEARTAVSDIEEALNAFADEMLGNVTADTMTEDTLDSDSGEPPVDSAEEGVIAVAAAPNTPAHTEVETIPVANEPTPLDTSGSEVSTTSETPAPPMTAEEAINLLPKNSMSYALDETTSRFSGAAWFNAIQLSTVILAGLGGIGSYILFCLSRMKPKQIFVYDDDVVEMANLSGQLYSSAMIGKRKVDAMAELARNFSCYYGVQAVPQRFTADTPAGDIMICGFDNMQARKEFFGAWVNHLVKHPMPQKCLFIDGRLSMEEFQVFCMRGNDTYSIEKYHKEYLFEDYQAESVQCSMKQTTYCANMIGSVIVNLFTNFIANQLKPLIDRDLPFKTYYDASMMYFKTEV